MRPGLLRVVVGDAPAAPERKAAIEVELHGARVRMRAGVDRAALASVNGVLEERGRVETMAGAAHLERPALRARAP